MFNSLKDLFIYGTVSTPQLDNATLGAILILIVFLAILSFIFYIIQAITQAMWLKKSNIKNWGLAFVPVANMYKQLHYVYDEYNATRTKDKQPLNSSEYVKTRRSFSLKVLLIVFVIIILMGIISSIIEVNLSEQTTLISNSVSTTLSLILFGIMTYTAHRSVSKKETSVNGETSYVDMSKFNALTFSLLAIITLGISYYIMFIYYSRSDNYRYRYNIEVNEHRLND